MASLVELKAQMDAQATPAPVPSPTPTPAPLASPPARGDDLMAKVQGRDSVPDEDTRMAKLFQQSQQLVQARMQEDPAYAQKIGGELQGLSGKSPEGYFQRVIDEGDTIKLDYLKKQNPDWFNSGEAARVGFFNEATFGQMSKIIGGAGVLLQGRDYNEVVAEKAEQFRLLQKAFPGSFKTGEAASFLMPGSPAKYLFEKAAGVGTHLVGKVLGKVAENPKFFERLVRSAATSSAGAGAGSAAVGGVEGTLGTDLQTISFDRGVEQSLLRGAQGAVVGGALGAGFTAAAEGLSRATPAIRAGAGKVRDAVASGVEQLSGTPAEALRAFNRAPEVIKRAAGTEAQIGADLVDFLQTQRLSQLPEVAQANKLLEEMPAVDGRPVIGFLRSVKAGLDPGKEAHVKLLGEWADRIEAAFPTQTVQTRFAQDGVGTKAITETTTASTAIPATRMREIVDEMQDAVRNQYGKESPFLASQLKQAARIARQSIVDMAGKQGEIGADYVQLMQKAADKRGTLKFITKQLGTHPEVQQIRSEGFIRRVFGGNKDLVQQRMAELDSQFGTNFMELARNANYAKQINANGSGAPANFSNLSTGKALAGVVTGGAVGGAPGALVGQAASSPRAGAAIIGASDAITGFVKRMTANPDVLERLAGRIAPKAGTSAQAAKQMAQLRVPLEIRRLANDVLNTFQKDGPISAGSLTRVIADTPYFFPLVHYYEVAERRMKGKNIEQGLTAQQVDPNQTRQ
jgi:hypothetical protein